jgi:hypothetical protein
MTFMDKASTIQKEKADALAKAEMEELQGLTSSLASKRRTDEGEEEDVQANAPDRDAVEKALIHNASQFDEKHRSQPTLHIKKFMEALRHETVQQCQLSDAELRGFLAECDIDEREEIQYVEHIKSWVPIIFELRKSRVYDNILAKDWGVDAESLIDLAQYEERFPLLVGDDDIDPRQLRRRPSQSRLTGRRSSSRIGGQRMSRSSTKENREFDASQVPRKGKSKHRPQSRSDKDRPNTPDRKKQTHRPMSRSGSVRSFNRTNSSDSVSSHASVNSMASVASHCSRASRR